MAEAFELEVATPERLIALRPARIYPGHGPLVEDGVAKLREYLDHRRQRVQQVVEALTTRGPSTIAELVAAIYVGLAPNLAPMAGRNVAANLEKLAEEGTVALTAGDRWELTS